jgi:hypothetical protein
MKPEVRANFLRDNLDAEMLGDVAFSEDVLMTDALK